MRKNIKNKKKGEMIHEKYIEKHEFIRFFLQTQEKICKKNHHLRFYYFFLKLINKIIFLILLKKQTKKFVSNTKFIILKKL